MVTDGVDSKVIILDWQHMTPKVEAAYSFPLTVISRATFNPKDDDNICTSGDYHWKMWRKFDPQTLKPLPPVNKLQGLLFTEHAWLENGYIVGGTKLGELILTEPGEV